MSWIKVTNTNFEGRKNSSRIAKFGRSKEKRSDAMLIVLATNLVFEKKSGVTIDEKAGIYFLRTSLNGKEEKTLWMIYNLIREIDLPDTQNRPGSAPDLSQN